MASVQDRGRHHIGGPWNASRAEPVSVAVTRVALKTGATRRERPRRDVCPPDEGHPPCSIRGAAQWRSLHRRQTLFRRHASTGKCVRLASPARLVGGLEGVHEGPVRAAGRPAQKPCEGSAVLDRDPVRRIGFDRPGREVPDAEVRRRPPVSRHGCPLWFRRNAGFTGIAARGRLQNPRHDGDAVPSTVAPTGGVCHLAAYAAKQITMPARR